MFARISGRIIADFRSEGDGKGTGMAYAALNLHHQPVVRAFLGYLVGHRQHFGRHMSEDRAFSLELVPVFFHVRIVDVNRTGFS